MINTHLFCLTTLLNKYYLFTTGNIICSNGDGTLPCTCHSLLQNRRFVPVGKPFLSQFPNRERHLLSRVWQPGQKGLPAPRGWHTLLSRLVLQNVLFFLFFSQLFFYFNYTFAFQLNLYIGIQCVWSPLIYIYIYSYLYNICPR